MNNTIFNITDEAGNTIQCELLDKIISIEEAKERLSESCQLDNDTLNNIEKFYFHSGIYFYSKDKKYCVEYWNCYDEFDDINQMIELCKEISEDLK